MNHWFMLTLVGKDQRGIVAQVTTALYEGGCNLGEASMLRLRGNFTIMLMVCYEGTVSTLAELLKPVTDNLQLLLHIDPIEDYSPTYQEPNVRISVHGADRAGIVAQVATTLAQAGLNITDLESDLGGSVQQPLYVMHIEGIATMGITAIETAIQILNRADLNVQFEQIETLIL
jgi:glycine cleavage system transcriptional repressor